MNVAAITDEFLLLTLGSIVATTITVTIMMMMMT